MAVPAFCVGCYNHIRAIGFLRTSKLNMALQFHVSCIIQSLWELEGNLIKRKEYEKNYDLSIVQCSKFLSDVCTSENTKKS